MRIVGYSPLDQLLPTNSAEGLALMEQIDRIHTAQPFRGSRRIVDALADQGQLVNRKRVRRLMQLMGIQAIHPFSAFQ